MSRSIARRAAMQLLYEQMSGGEADGESLSLVYEQFSKAGKEKNPSPKDEAYIQDVLEGVAAHRQELDQLIEANSSGEWALNRVANVDRSILRLAAYEMLFRQDIPNNVAISEAMELAALYSEPKSSRYINGVLGAIDRSQPGE